MEVVVAQRVEPDDLGRPIRAQVPPWRLVKLGLGAAGLFDRGKRDLLAMMTYIQKGTYVADVANQRRYLGEVPNIESVVRRYLADVGLLPPAGDAARTSA